MSPDSIQKCSITCYACGTPYEYDFHRIQEERLAYKYSKVVENKEQPRNYYVRCPSCDKFNRTRH